MKSITTILFLMLCTIGLSQSLTVYKSPMAVEESVDKIVETIDGKGLSILDTVEYHLLAAEGSVEIPPTTMILFEDSDLMIELISCRQTTALDSPLKILVWEENKDVYIGFFDPKVMKKRFLLDGCDDIIERLSRLMVRIVNEVLKEG